jgi:hypothetical protein
LVALLRLYNIVAFSDVVGDYSAFPVPWLEPAVLLAATVAASLLATAAPSISTTRIRPAVAPRRTD